MASLIKSVKAFGEKATGQKINGDTLMGVMKDMGQKMTGKEIKGNSLLDIIDATTEDYAGGGAKVVTELPQVGEPHTIYELQETKVADFPWLLTMFDRNAFYPTINRPFVVIETEEQNTQEYLKLDGDTNCFVYVKTTNKVYSWKIGEDVYSVEEIEPEDYIYYDSKYAFAILKDFDYHVTTTQPGEEYHDPILDGTGHFLDGTEFNIEDGWWDVVPLVLTDATNKEVLVNESLIGFEEVTSETPLENPVQVDKIDLSILTYLDERKDVIFTPQPSRTISTYWIYTDREWVNVDDIKSTLHKTVYGTLTDVDGSLTLACSITYDEIVNNFKNGDITILEYKPTDGDGYYYCAITDAQWGEADNPSLQLKTWSLLYGWLQYSPSQGFSFNNGVN